MGAKTKQLRGRIKQAAGSLTGNKKLERQGRVDRQSAEATKRLNDVTAKVEEVIDKTADAVSNAIKTGSGTRRNKSPRSR
jgi:uncharacterized protein YjbJ (UPF0337 family)